MVCAQETDRVQISDHALKRFYQRSVRLGLDVFDSDWQLLEVELRRILAISAWLDITSLRNWKKRKRILLN